MATPRWFPKSPTRRQITTIQITAYDAATTYKCTVSQSVASCIAGGSVNATATALAAACEAMTEGEFTELEFTASTDTVTITGPEDGTPFTATGSVSGGTGTQTTATPTTATSPNHWGLTANWSTGALPADGDDVIIDYPIPIKWDLDQSAIEPATCRIFASFSGDGGTIGLPETNTVGDEYREYRSTYLTLGAVILKIGEGEGDGSDFMKIDAGSDPVAASVYRTGKGSDTQPALLLKGSDSTNTLVVRGDSDVGIAMVPGETATLATMSVEGGANVKCGSGTTLSGALTVNDGTVKINSLIDGSLTVLAGTVTIDGTGNVDQLTIRGGTVVYNTSGTLGGATIVSGDGLLDFSGDQRAKAVTNPIDVYDNGQVLDPKKVVSSLVVDYNEGAAVIQALGIGGNLRVTRAAVA